MTSIGEPVIGGRLTRHTQIVLPPVKLIGNAVSNHPIRLHIRPNSAARAPQLASWSTKLVSYKFGLTAAPAPPSAIRTAERLAWSRLLWAKKFNLHPSLAGS